MESQNCIIQLKTITKRYHEPENLERNYARFNDICEQMEVEIIVLKGHEAKVDLKLHEFLLKHPEVLKEYVRLKQKYAFSKREYQKQKNTFLAKVIERI